MSNSRPIMDELDVMMMCDEKILDQIEQIDADIEAQIKAIDCPMTNVLEGADEEIDYSIVDSLDPLDSAFQDCVDDTVDDIIDINDMVEDSEGDLIDHMIGI